MGQENDELRSAKQSQATANSIREMQAANGRQLAKREIFRRTFRGQNLDIRHSVRDGKTTIVVSEPVDSSPDPIDTDGDTHALKAS